MMRKVFLLLVLACLSVSRVFAAGELFVGELTSPKDGISFTTQTLAARTQTPLKKPFEFGKPYTMNIRKIYDGAVDLVFRFSQECFLDHAELTLSGACEGAKVQVFVDDKPISEATPLQAGRNVVVPGWRSDHFTFRLYKDVRYLETAALEVVQKEYKDFKLDDIHLFGGANLEAAVFPLPSRIALGEGYLPRITGVKAPKKEFAATNFVEKYARRFGEQLPRKGNLELSLDKSLGKEAFSIEVTPSGAVLRGGSSRALLYAGEKLLRMVEPDGRVRCVSIQDEPAFPIRGIHAALPPREDLDMMRRIVRDVYMPYGYNTLFLEIKGTMEFKRHPEINKANCRKPQDLISQDEVAELCAYIRRYGLDVIPLLQSVGHVQFISKAHPELGERAEMKEDKDVNLLAADKRSKIGRAHV